MTIRLRFEGGRIEMYDDEVDTVSGGCGWNLPTPGWTLDSLEPSLKPCGKPAAWVDNFGNLWCDEHKQKYRQGVDFARYPVTFSPAPPQA